VLTSQNARLLTTGGKRDFGCGRLENTKIKISYQRVALADYPESNSEYWKQFFMKVGISLYTNQTLDTVKKKS